VWSILFCEPGDPSSLELFDIFGGAIHTFTDWDAEVGDVAIVFFIAVGDRVENLLITADPLLQIFDALLVTTPLLCVVGVMLRSVTIPYKNLIQYLSLRPLTPAKPPSSHSIPSKILSSSLVPSGTHSSARIPPSLLVPSSTRSSLKTPDTYPDPNHPLCHTNDITHLDPDPDPDL
jgi:hypothetical protein